MACLTGGDVGNVPGRPYIYSDPEHNLTDLDDSTRDYVGLLRDLDELVNTDSAFQVGGYLTHDQQ
jgi:hypothetical protein